MGPLFRSAILDAANAHDAFVKDRVLRASLLYALVVTLLGAVLNRLSMGHSVSDHPTGLSVVSLSIYPLLWVPTVVVARTAGRSPAEYGIGSTRLVPLVLALSTAFVLVIPAYDCSLRTCLFEAYARASEEAFFRGFLIGELNRLFARSRRPSVWAVAISSFLFAVAHTHQPVAEILGRVYTTAILLGLTATWMRSTCLSTAIHCAASGGRWAGLMGIAMWLGLFLWARRYVNQRSQHPQDVPLG